MRAVALFAALAAVAEASDATKLRRLMTDSRFLSMVFPCTVGGNNRNSPSEWLRTAFHDAANYDAAEGTGGIDGSIFYETDYEANRGATFSTVMTEYKFYQQDGVTLADIVALGATVAVGACGGPVLDYYHGRTDVGAGSGEGYVPEPNESTESHIATFARMGFTPTEMISLVACGHTIGGVKKAVNPTLTNDTYHHFDETHAAFDNRVAIEYINDTRQNPLAQPYDADYPERSSDTRIFEVDNNATLSKYAASQDAMMADCKTVFSKMLNEAVPSSVTLQGPITPFPVSGTWWPNTRNGNSILPSSTSSVRLYDMVGQWTSFEMGYTYRDGTEATDDWIVLAAVRTISNGKPIEVRDFNSASVPINPAKGLGSLLIKVTLNDGTMYTSEEGEEVMPFDDTILVDIGNLYTCKYSDTANNNAAGMNMTVHVLGPYDAADNVEMIFRNDEMELQYITANYMGARDDYYNLYNIFIPDVTALGFTGFGARVTRADGSVHKDTKDDDYYRYSSLSKCVAGVDVPAPIPVPSAAARRRAARKRLAPACPSGRSLCGGQCVDILRNIEHCGGCAGAGGVDCTAISDGSIACIAGQCVRS